jgi:hypothetical protein
MPAINLTRLRIQTAKLMDKFGYPEEFIRELHNFFDFYADRTLRKSAVVSPISILPSYRVPPPVMRHLEHELGARVQNDPEQIFILADILWEDGYYETRLLAAHLLSCMTPGGEAFVERLTSWVSETRDPAVANPLLTTSLARMRSETPDEFLKLMTRWAHPSRKKLGPNVMIALIPLLKEGNFINLPAVFNIVQPLVESAAGTSQRELSNLVCALYEASPIETAFFLRRLLSLSPHPHTNLNIRRIMASLPQELQAELREAVRK